MFNLFGLEFYIYDSQSKSLIFSPNNDPINTINNVGQGNYFNHGVNNIIFSWHYLRNSVDETFKLTEADRIDMVVVDEAHGARMSQQINGEVQSTLLYTFLSQLLGSVRHKLLLTATPFQTNSMDYLSLLRLMMGNDSLEVESLEKIKSLNSHLSLVNQQKVDAVKELVENLVYKSKGLPENIDSSNFELLFDCYSDELYIQNHPTTIYTIRNTRDQLKEIGYQFPIVHLQSESIQLDKKQKLIFQLASNYIENDLFNFESSLGLGRPKDGGSAQRCETY